MSAPIGKTCPDIDRAIKPLKCIVRQYCNKMDIDSLCEEDAQSVVREMRDLISDAIDAFEDLRSSNYSLREWGKEMEEEAETATVRYNELEEKYNDLLTTKTTTL